MFTGSPTRPDADLLPFPRRRVAAAIALHCARALPVQRTCRSLWYRRRYRIAIHAWNYAKTPPLLQLSSAWLTGRKRSRLEPGRRHYASDSAGVWPTPTRGLLCCRADADFVGRAISSSSHRHAREQATSIRRLDRGARALRHARCASSPTRRRRASPTATKTASAPGAHRLHRRPLADIELTHVRHPTA